MRAVSTRIVGLSKYLLELYVCTENEYTYNSSRLRIASPDNDLKLGVQSLLEL